MSGQFPMYPGTYGQEDQQPYAYGMNVPQPQSMNINGHSQLLPPLNPSLLSPQLSNPTSGMNNDLPQYAHGGMIRRTPYHPQMHPRQHMPYNMPRQHGNNNNQMPYNNGQEQFDNGEFMPLRHGGIQYRMSNQPQRMMKKGGLAKAAQRIKAAGTDGDTILAHISPLEAAQLAAQAGGTSINPHTGLPSYKFKLGKILKTVARVAAPFVGGAVAGPVGAAIGGGLAGAIGSGSTKEKIVKGVVGAGLGYTGAGGLGELGGVGKIIPTVNNAVGLTGLANTLGIGAKTAGTVGALTALNETNAPTAEPSKGLGGLDLGTIAPLAIMGGLALAAEKKSPTEDLGAALNNAKHEWGPEQQYRKMRPLHRALRSLGAEEYLRPGAPELQYFEDTNPEGVPYAHGGLVHYMAHGGHLDGYDGGQDDTIDAKLSDGEFVIPADIVSHMGDGNNNAGAKKLDHFMRSVRQHKTSKGAKGLPPKAKSMQAYMQARGVR